MRVCVCVCARHFGAIRSRGSSQVCVCGCVWGNRVFNILMHAHLPPPAELPADRQLAAIVLDF